MPAPTYGFQKSLSYKTLEEARPHVEAALKEAGFGILTEIDVRETLKKKIDADFRPYLILGACNPALAHRALSTDPNVGLLLPCNVVLEQREPGTVLVSIASPRALFKLLGAHDLAPIADEADERLRRAFDELA